MRSSLPTLLGRLNLTLLGIAVLAATFWFTDHTTNQHPPAPHIDREALIARHRAAPARPELFVLILDSLRYETATNADIMPQLHALQAEGVYAKVRPGFNSSSAAAVRDAFTGRENAAVLALVSTFLKTDAGVESIFHQMALAGLTSTAHSTGFFKQFGAGVTHEVEIPYRSTRDVDEENVLGAAKELAGGDYDVAIGHLNYTDYASHDFGISRREYREAFHRADAFIPRVRALLPPEATFVVMGDHGHDETGKHGFGMEVPTFTVYVGTAFRRGYDLGTISLTSHRYLMSHALDLEVTSDRYTGEHLPQAINAEHDRAEWLLAHAEAARHNALHWVSWFTWSYLCLLAALWINLMARGHTPLVFTPRRSAALWLAVVPLLLPPFWQMVAGCLVMATLLAILGRGVRWQKLAWWVAAPAAGGLAFLGWGRVLIAMRPALQQISYGALELMWLIVAVVGACLATRARRTTVMWVVTGLALLLPYGTNERYGFQGTLSPLLGCWLIFFIGSLWRDGGLTERAGVGKILFGAVGVFLLLQPFAATGATGGIFGRWHSLVPGLDSDNLVYLGLLAFFAKAVIFFPRWPGVPRLLLGAGLIALLVLIEGRIFGPDAYTMIGMILTALVGGWTLGVKLGRPEGRMLQLTFWFLLYYYWTALTPRNFLEIGCLIGALTLCARIVTWFPQRENVRADYLVFAVCGLLITGWACMRWTTSELEWHPAYEFFSAPTIEHWVAVLVVWIAFKCLLAWRIVLKCLGDELGQFEALPANALLLIFSIKLTSMLLLNAGLGGADTLNRSYLEGACVSGVLAILFLGVILLPRAWPRPVAAAST